MQFKSALFTLASVVAIASAAVATPEGCRKPADPGNPANLVNCEPNGGADDCHFEHPVRVSPTSFISHSH